MKPTATIHRVLVAGALGLTGVTAQAQEASSQEASSWSGDGEFGLAVATGNTDNQVMTARLGLARELERWRHAGSFDALQSEADGITTAERYVIAAKSDFKLGEHLYLFGSLRHENDEFGSFDRQTTAAVGIGDRFIDSGKMTLDLSAGLGLRSSRIRSSGQTDDETVVRLGGVFDYRFNANVSIGEQFLVESGADNTYIESATGLSAKINDSLAAKFSYLIKNNSDVSAGTDKTDTLTTASLVYSF